jgi:hypothetical protein
VDVCAASASEGNVLGIYRSENTCGQRADGYCWCVRQVVDVPTVAVMPKLVNVTVYTLVDDML